MSAISADVVRLHSTRMTEASYDAERARLRELYGDTRTEAGAKFEQALAALFHRSGWTQEELAKKEGKSPQQIARQLRFGRFLNFSPMGENPELLPNNLTERRFRGYWEQTEGDERIRFKAIQRMMREQVKLAKDRRPQIGPDIKKNFADGKWHSVEEIADDLDADPAHVKETIDGICKNQTYQCKAERRKVGKSKEVQYRIFNMDKTISLSELIEKLDPIIKDLEEQGRRGYLTIATNVVAVSAGKLRKLLAEWAE